MDKLGPQVILFVTPLAGFKDHQVAFDNNTQREIDWSRTCTAQCSSRFATSRPCSAPRVESVLNVPDISTLEIPTRQ